MIRMVTADSILEMCGVDSRQTRNTQRSPCA